MLFYRKKITGPWTYGGFVTGAAKHGFTIHPSVIEFKKNAKITVSLVLNAIFRHFPEVPAKQPLNSVEMGDWKTFPEMILDIPYCSGTF
jgi:hypothetical protein